MAPASPDERNKQPDKLFKDISYRVKQQMKEANKSLKDYYKTEYDFAVRDCEIAASGVDTLTALFSDES